MPRLPRSASPPWSEHDAFRETALQNFPRQDRKALRRVGRMLSQFAVETIRALPDESMESMNGAELRAIAADLRYTSRYCAMVVGRSPEWHRLDAEDEALAHFASKLARRIDALVQAIEAKLS